MAPKHPKLKAIKVDKGVPMPKASGGSDSSLIWPWHQMKRGDSFFAPGYVQQSRQKKNGERLISTTYAQRQIPGSKWATRLVVERGVRGVRIWRMK